MRASSGRPVGPTAVAVPAAPAAPAVLAAVAAGGALGACARWALTRQSHAAQAGEILSQAAKILTINIAGSFLMGILIAAALRRSLPRLARPFLGTGLLGGFTTFSTFAYDAQSLARAGHGLLAAGYVVATPVLAVTACWLGVQVSHRVLGGSPPTEPEAGEI